MGHACLSYSYKGRGISSLMHLFLRLFTKPKFTFYLFWFISIESVLMFTSVQGIAIGVLASLKWDNFHLCILCILCSTQVVMTTLFYCISYKLAS